MRDAVANEIHDATVFISAAAVSDYRVKQKSETKIKKSNAELDLRLERTPDILGEVAASRRNGQLVIGFAAETNNVIANASEKILSKNLDAIVANDVSGEHSGFDSENNAVVILLRDDPAPIEVPLMPKLSVAHRILDEIVKLRRSNNTGRTASNEDR